METKKTTIRLKPITLELLTRLAAKHGVSKTAVIILLIHQAAKANGITVE